ncbi:ATP-dependent RNA helicase DDX18 [Microtus ochrogaster]|uniref:ATP-dependent RNA helicase DDX18 n=1 Tax=Microtus ochrogaster TaxID=79684 RepID=A0A8J6GRG0_MICOH|nr:ATP-dependent RNA helicase DDX18 [Microtus ochrogaster]
MSHLQMKLLRKKIEKRNIKLWQRNLKLQEASNTSHSQPSSEDVPKEASNTSHSQPSSEDVPKEEVKVGKVKKAVKHAARVGSAEAQSGGMPEETVANSKVTPETYCYNQWRNSSSAIS